MNIKIKKLDKNNFDDFFDILNEMNLWAHKVEMEKGSKNRLKKHYFAKSPKFQCLVAYMNNKPAGFVSFFETYATMEGKAGMYIEDIFILDEYRHKGVGKAFISKCIDIAKKNKYCRVDLLSFGEGPRKFYEKIGANWQEHNYHYRIPEDLIKKGIN